MAREKPGSHSKKANRKVPPWGRKESKIKKDLGLHNYSADVPLGNTDPTVVQGKLYSGGGSGMNRPARGGLRRQKGKRG